MHCVSLRSSGGLPYSALCLVQHRIQVHASDYGSSVFHPVVRPKMCCIMAVIDQKESLLAVACARLLLLVFYTSRCVPCCRSQALMPCIMAGMDQMFLDMVVHKPVVCNDICLWSRLLILRSLRSCSPSRSSTSLSRRRGSLSWSRQFVRP